MTLTQPPGIDDYVAEASKRAREREMQVSFQFRRARDLLQGVFNREGVPRGAVDDCKQVLDVLQKGADDAFLKAYNSDAPTQPLTFNEWVSSTNQLVQRKSRVLFQVNEMAQGRDRRQ
jgi:hypothetical protein